MKVILNSDVHNLGEEGDICNVAPGYARNFLLPKGLVLEHNDRNVAAIEVRRAEIEQRKAEKRKQASGLKERIEAEPMVVSMTAGTNGKLFGSVTVATIVERLASLGVDVERKKVDIPEKSIKTVGNFKVRIRLYGDEEAVLTVSVEASNAREIEKEKAKEEAAEAKAAEASDAPGEDVESEDEAAGESAEDNEEESVDEELDPEVMAMRAAQEEADARDAATAADDEETEE